MNRSKPTVPVPSAYVGCRLVGGMSKRADEMEDGVVPFSKMSDEEVISETYRRERRAHEVVDLQETRWPVMWRALKVGGGFTAVRGGYQAPHSSEGHFMPGEFFESKRMLIQAIVDAYPDSDSESESDDGPVSACCVDEFWFALHGHAA